jgi:hypothetical protein
MRTCKDPKSPKDLRTHLKDHQDPQDLKDLIGPAAPTRT